MYEFCCCLHGYAWGPGLNSGGLGPFSPIRWHHQCIRALPRYTGRLVPQLQRPTNGYIGPQTVVGISWNPDCWKVQIPHEHCSELASGRRKPLCQNQLDPFICFDRTPTCDRQTDRQTRDHGYNRASIASRGKNDKRPTN